MNIQREFISLDDGTELFYQMHYSKQKDVWLIATHGIAEHSGRHAYLLNIFKNRFNILQYDLRGHGQSFGRRAYINDFNKYAKDLMALIRFIKIRYNMKEYVLFGHSMGALIVADYMQNLVKEEFYPLKVFLSAPPVGIPGALGRIVDLIPLSIWKALHAIPFSMALPGLVDIKNLSHDQKVYNDFMKDDLTSLKLHSRLLFGLVKRSKEIFSKPLNIKCPLYCVVGTNDHIIDPSKLNIYFTGLEKNTTLKMFQNAYHELHSELDIYRMPYLEFLEESLV